MRSLGEVDAEIKALRAQLREAAAGEEQQRLRRTIESLFEEKRIFQDTQLTLIKSKDSAAEATPEVAEEQSTVVTPSDILHTELLQLRSCLGVAGPYYADFEGRNVAVAEEHLQVDGTYTVSPIISQVLQSAAVRARPVVATWDPERDEEQQKQEYRAKLEELVTLPGYKWHFGKGKRKGGDRTIVWKYTVETQFPGVPFAVRGTGDMVLYRPGREPRCGAIMGVDVVSDVLGDLSRYLDQAETQYYLCSDGSHDPYVQVVTDLRVAVCIFCVNERKRAWATSCKLYYSSGTLDEFVSRFIPLWFATLGSRCCGSEQDQALQVRKFVPDRPYEEEEPVRSGSKRVKLDEREMRRLAAEMSKVRLEGCVAADNNQKITAV